MHEKPRTAWLRWYCVWTKKETLFSSCGSGPSLQSQYWPVWCVIVHVMASSSCIRQPSHQKPPDLETSKVIVTPSSHGDSTSTWISYSKSPSLAFSSMRVLRWHSLGTGGTLGTGGGSLGTGGDGEWQSSGPHPSQPSCAHVY